MSSNKMDEQEERWGKRNKEKAEIQQLYEFNEKHFDQGSEAYGTIDSRRWKTIHQRLIWAVLNNSPYNTREDYEDGNYAGTVRVFCRKTTMFSLIIKTRKMSGRQ